MDMVIMVLMDMKDVYIKILTARTSMVHFLAKNPELADRFIKMALEIKYSEVALEKLDDSLELKAKEVMITRLNTK